MTEQVAVLSTWQSEFKLRHPSMTYVEQAQEAAAGCMAKVSMCPDDIDAIVYSLAPTAFMGVADADRWAIDHIFGAGKPMLRVHTGGATGGSVVQAAHALVRSGMYRTVMIVGAERISETPDAQKVLNQIFDPFYEKDMPLQTITAVALMANTYMRRHGITQEDVARLVVRQRRNALLNPHAHLKGNITVDDVMASPMIAYPFKLFDICPRSSGGAAMIVGNMDAARQWQTRPAFITGVGAVSDSNWIGDRIVPSAEYDFIDWKLMRVAGRAAFERAGITDPIHQVQVAEVYDAFSIQGLTQLEQLGFCASGTGFLLEGEGAWEMDGGQVAVCPSGGTLCTNPIAVAGLVRAIEAANQVMGTAGGHQVKNVRRSLATAVGGIAQFLTCSVFSHEPYEAH
jgi:acetyl-CoA C-acetyltransferase